MKKLFLLMTLAGLMLTGCSPDFDCCMPSEADFIINGDPATLQSDPFNAGPPNSSLFPDLFTNNTIKVNSGNIDGFVFGGVSTGADEVSGNIITMTNGVVGWSIYGGYSVDGIVKNNSVTMANGEVGHLIVGGLSENENATNNSVTITGGVISGALGGASNMGTASNNSVTITGGTINGPVVGGSAMNSATNNTITISGAPTFGASSVLLGGGLNVPVGDAFTGNILNVLNYSGNAVDVVANFQFFNFTFPSTQGSPVLKATVLAALGTPLGSSSITIEVTGAPLMVGTEFTLIEAGTLDTSFFTQTTFSGGGYDWDLLVVGNDLIAKVTAVL
ncbi:MAG: hypothetical protein FWD56_06165 [Bacteroidales bacterium]|nr:hypothetical protein [Bacteroidales bacterium]